MNDVFAPSLRRYCPDQVRGSRRIIVSSQPGNPGSPCNKAISLLDENIIPLSLRYFQPFTGIFFVNMIRNNLTHTYHGFINIHIARINWRNP